MLGHPWVWSMAISRTGILLHYPPLTITVLGLTWGVPGRTMDRFGGGQGQEFAETYQVEYWRESLGGWHLYTNTTGHDVLAGNTNTYLAHKQDLHPPIVASRVRFLPVSVSIPCDHVYPVSYSVTGTPQDYLYEGGGVWLSSH